MTIRINLIGGAFLGAATAVATTAADAQVSDDVLRIGVINDMSGVYSDLGGEGSVAAAKLAVEDFGRRCWARRSNCFRRSPEQAGHRGRDRAALDRRERRRCHRRRR